ncbi:MAG: DoxX family protein [Acidobacteriaceae bacterium]
MTWSAPQAAALTLLRIVAGFLFFCHGAQKILGWFGGHGGAHGLMLAAGSIELIAGILIIIGLFTHIAAFIASGEMAVAYFTVHQPGGALPIQNHGELAVALCFIFLSFAAVGAGPWSVDGLRRPH